GPSARHGAVLAGRLPRARRPSTPRPGRRRTPAAHETDSGGRTSTLAPTRGAMGGAGGGERGGRGRVGPTVPALAGPLRHRRATWRHALSAAGRPRRALR